MHKLRLNLWDAHNLPNCWCGLQHNTWGDHVSSCTANRKTGTHNYIVKGSATALQPAIATAGYILPIAILNI